MKRPPPSAIVRGPYRKALVGVVATVFLGAIGSGLWDLLLAPLLDRLSGVSLSLMSWLFHGYTDVLYRNVSRNPSEQLTMLPFVAVAVSVIVVPWIGLYYLFRVIKRAESNLSSLEEGKDQEMTRDGIIRRIKQSRRFAIRIGIPLALLTTLLYSETVFQAGHSRSAAMFVERSIEIVAPHVDEHERLELRAQFRGIETAADFYRLEARLRGIALQHSLTLPRFESIH